MNSTVPQTSFGIPGLGVITEVRPTSGYCANIVWDYHRTKTENIESELEDLEIEYTDQIARVKNCTQSGIQKCKYPQFSGKILNYYEFKDQWFEEVAPERKPEVWELNALKDQIPSLGKNKLH